MSDPQFEHWWDELITKLDLPESDLLKPQLHILKAVCKKILQSTLGPNA